jgi:hypothetical protein
MMYLTSVCYVLITAYIVWKQQFASNAPQAISYMKICVMKLVQVLHKFMQTMMKTYALLAHLHAIIVQGRLS